MPKQKSRLRGVAKASSSFEQTATASESMSTTEEAIYGASVEET
jgi:hypothetical protein